MFKTKQINFFSLVVIVLLVLSNCFHFVQAEEPDRIITITADENKLYSYLSLGGFMENCRGDESKHRVYGEGDEINLVLQLNLDQGTVTGTLSGSGSDTKYSYSYENHWDFSGSISGIIKQVLTGSFYHWELSGTADITLHCIGMLRCYNEDTESYETNTEEQNIVITANITASSYTNFEGGFGQFGIHWSDNGGSGGMSRSFYINCGPTSGSECSLTDELPDPINLSISLNGPDRIDKGTTSAVFNLNPSGRDRDLVDQVWYHFYYKNPDWTPDDVYSSEWIWFENHIKEDLTDLTISQVNISKWLDLVDQYGTIINGVKQLAFKLEVSVEDENGFTLVYHDPTANIFPNVTYVCSNSKTNRYQLLGLSTDHPMKHINVNLCDENDDIDYETSTDESGYFTLPEMDDGARYNLMISFEYISENITYFDMYDTKTTLSPDYPVSLTIAILNNNIENIEFHGSKKSTILIHESLSNQINLYEYLTSKNGLISYISIYYHLTEAIEFYTEYLDETMTYKLPVSIFVFTNRFEDPTSYRWGKLGGTEAVWIQIDSRKSNHGSDWRPIAEFHEFSHYMMHNLYNMMPSSPDGPIKDVNHGGYINPSTADSYSEGFAEFMSVIIANHYQRWWIENPTKRSYTSLCTGHGSLEPNNVAWGNAGKDEEWAVAGVLWDLFDGTEESQTEYNRLQEKWENEYKRINAEFDINGDGQLDKNEFRTKMIIKHYDWSAVDYIPRAKLVQFMGELVTPFKGSNEEVLTDEVFSTYEKNNPILTYDKNNDIDLNGTELLSFLKSKNITDTDELENFAYAYLNGYDFNKDDALSGKELTRLAAGEELHRTVLETYDSNKDGLISKNELYSWTKKEGDTIFKVCFRGSGTSSSDLEEALLLEESLPEIITEEYILNHLKKGDDDAVDLSFEEIWLILRNVHNDFTSVYYSFIETYPQLKDEIDAIFIKHGFFIETQKGNNQWDFNEPFQDLNSNVIYDKDDFFIDYPNNGFSYNQGETIGSAGDFNRQERRSFEALPGHYIKTNNEVPFYRVEVSLYDDPFLYYAFPSSFYEYEIMNVDGLIYVPIPPVDYHAIMNIAGIDVQTGNPLIIEAEDFYDNIDEVIEKGYYLSHDFEISGEIPDYPVDPFMVSSDSSNNDNDSSSPGFEIMMLICSLFFIFFFTRKTKK